MRFPWRRRDFSDRDLDEEIETHLALETQRRIADGESPEAAARSARRAFGNVTRVKEVTRSVLGLGGIESFALDLRYAARRMRQAPGFSAVAVATLMLGIGANTAIFGVVDAAFFRPLPFPESDRLVRLFATRHGAPEPGISRLDARDLAVSADSFEGIAVYDRWRKNVAGIGGSREPEETVVGLAPGAYFELLRVAPILGRLFTPEESVFGKHFVAAIGAGLWRARFAADPEVLGKTLRINGESYTIVAVLPDAFPTWMSQTSVPISIWTPYVSSDMWDESKRTGRDEACLGRLKPGVTLTQARAELTNLAGRLAREHPVDRGVGATLEPLADTRSGPVGPLIRMLFGAVAMVLLIACANLAGLLLARNTVRARELALRAVLGAPRSRILRQLLLEALVLSVSGSVAGLGLALAAGRALAHAGSGGGTIPYTTASNALPQFWSGAFDARILLFSAGVCAATAVLCGLAPAFAAANVPFAEALKEGGRTGGIGRSRQRLRRAMVVAEAGLSLVLVFAAALLAQTVARLERQDPGFPTDRLLLAHVFIPSARYADSGAITAFSEAFAERVRALPGVRDASVATGYPPSLPWRQVFTVPGSPVSRAEDVPAARFAAVDSRYLRTLGLRLVGGRDFRESDTPASRSVAIVNEEFARRYFPGRDPLGREIRPGPPEGVPPVPLEDFGGSRRDITIVGVVRNFMNDGPARPAAPQLFMLFRQVPGLNFGFKDIVVRAESNPEILAPAVARALHSLDAEIPLGEVQTMEDHLGRQTADRKFATAVLGLFAGLGLLLALVGAYGVVSYLVSQRTHELGVRLALGARAADILWLVLRSSFSIAAAGTGLGVAGALAARRSLAGLLYGVGASDPATLAGAAALLILVILAASAVPAARAMRIDPAEALRAS